MKSDEYDKIYRTTQKVIHDGVEWEVKAADWCFGDRKMLIFRKTERSEKSKWVKCEEVEIINQKNKHNESLHIRTNNRA